MMRHCLKPTVMLMLGTVLVHISICSSSPVFQVPWKLTKNHQCVAHSSALEPVICSTVSKVTETCSTPPSTLEPVIHYDFDVNGSSYIVCPTSHDGSQKWVFRPASANTRGTYTVNGTDLQRCVYNTSSSQRLELVVTPPGDQNESGDFIVTFDPETGNTITLTVSYRPRGFYMHPEVDGSTVQELFFKQPFCTKPFCTKPLWRAVGLGLGDSVVCQLDGNDKLKSVPYLDISDDPSTYLRGNGTLHESFNVSLGISSEVPNDCIGETITVVLVTGSCQNPVLCSEPVQIRALNASVPTSPTSSMSPSPLRNQSSKRAKVNALKTRALRRAGVADLGTVPLETIETQMRRVDKQKRINKWPNATVPYDFDTNFSLVGRRKVLRAMYHFQKRTCITFVPHTNEKYYIKFVLSPFFCQSWTGMQMEEGEREDYDGQLVLLSEDCLEQRGIILHNLGHTIGFFHEHNRPDRDNFIEIQWENIREDLHDQFDKIPMSGVDSMGVPYDLGSIMHYSLDAFSKNGNATIKVILNPLSYTGEVGKRKSLSDLDVRRTNLLYSCSVAPYTIVGQPYSMPNMSVVAEWSDLSLNCSATGFPLPIIYWEREGGIPLSADTQIKTSLNNNMVTSTLTITELDVRDSGMVRCVASNPHTSAFSNYISVSVTPTLRLSAAINSRTQQVFGDRLIVPESSFVTVECFGSGILQWQTSSGLQISSKFQSMCFQQANSSRSVCTLSIWNFTRDTIDTYICILVDTLTKDQPLVRQLPLFITMSPSHSEANRLQIVLKRVNAVLVTSVLVIVFICKLILPILKWIWRTSLNCHPSVARLSRQSYQEIDIERSLLFLGLEQNRYHSPGHLDLEPNISLHPPADIGLHDFVPSTVNTLFHLKSKCNEQDFARTHRTVRLAHSMPLSVEQMHAAPISSSDNSPLVDLLTNEALCKTFSSKISQPLVPYVDPVEIVKCDSTGGVFYSSAHDFGFIIPEGAIPEGDSISIEVGVTLTGPFGFPQGCKPVSPIVKLCVQEQPNYKFLKPVEVVLPHYLDLTSEEDNSELQIGFWKAGHTLNDNKEYKFERMDLSSTHFKHEYGVLRTNHFCFLCIAEESGVTREITAVASFYLVGYKKLLNATEWKLYFCVAYFLATCVETLRRQFPVSEGYCEVFKTKFKFISQPPSERKIKIKYERGLSDEWMLALQSTDKISATDVDCWRIDAKELELMHKEGMHPPRFPIHVYATQFVSIPISFQGAEEDIKIELLLNPASSVNHTDVSRVTSMESEPQLCDLMNKVAVRHPHKWWEVGLQLGMTPSDLENLRAVYGGNSLRCFSMIFESWKEKTRNHSWAAIIAALEAPLVGEVRLAKELKASLSDPHREYLLVQVQNRCEQPQSPFPLNLAREDVRILGKCSSSEEIDRASFPGSSPHKWNGRQRRRATESGDLGGTCESTRSKEGWCWMCYDSEDSSDYYPCKCCLHRKCFKQWVTMRAINTNISEREYLKCQVCGVRYRTKKIRCVCPPKRKHWLQAGGVTLAFLVSVGAVYLGGHLLTKHTNASM